MSEHEKTDWPIDMRCPCCRYSLAGLIGAVCPECGQELDEVVIREIDGAGGVVQMTRLWAAVGVLAWVGFGVVIWFFGYLTIGLRHTYGRIAPTPFDIAGLWLRVLFVIGPIALLIGWRQSARTRLYQKMLKYPDRSAGLSKRVVIVTSL